MSNPVYINLCSQCSSLADSGKGWKFKRHYVTHFHAQFLGRNGSRDSCSLCGETFKKASMLSRHLGINHKWLDTCNQEAAEQATVGFAGPSNFSKATISKERRIVGTKPREETSSDTAGIVLFCYLCGKDVKNLIRSDLYRHYVTHYSLEILEMNRSSTECSFCHKEFVKPSDLARHVGVAHDKIDLIIPDCAKIAVPPSGKRYLKSISRRSTSYLPAPSTTAWSSPL